MSPSAELFAKRDRLLRLMAEYGPCAVAFSGGVDSAVVAKAAQLSLGNQAVAVTGKSDALATGELEEACSLAALIGIRHVVVETHELAVSNYIANGPDRCFHCKTTLYGEIQRIAAEFGLAVIVNGANVDDLGDYRPGMQAAADYRVTSPLVECGFTKQDVRNLAKSWCLPVADKPATPCLSSRVVYGQAISPQRLSMVDQAERFLRALGFRELRVRYHGDDLARIEVSQAELPELCESEIRRAVLDEFQRLGFKFVTLDLAGFRSGSFKQLVPLVELERFAR